MAVSRILVSVAAIGLSCSTATAQTLGFATGPQGTPTNATGAAVAKVVNEVTGIQTRAVPHTSNEISLPPLSRGQVDFAIANGDIAHAAYNGIDVFQGRKLDNLRVVTRLFPLNLGIIVRKDSTIKSAADLKGKCYPMGFTAQKGQIKVATALLANAGLTYKDVKGSPVPNTSRGNEDFSQGKCDSAMMALGAARLKQTDAQVGGVRIVPIDTSPEAIARMKKYVPYSYVYTLKAGSVPGAEVETPIMSYDIILMASTKTPEDAVYKAVKAMHGGKDKLTNITRVFRDFEPAKMQTNYEGLQYHAGALTFYKEAGVALMK
jgi:TRAP transporter TAXI family solute receptor